MENWSTHHIYQSAETKLGSSTASDLRAYAIALSRKNLPVIFTLNHLSKIVGVDYQFLRETVARKRESANYRVFTIKKRSGGRRHIHSVTGQLFVVHDFINSEVLQKQTPHTASHAFHPSGGIRKCAESHCGARWIFHYDLKDFFYSVTEATVYEIFKKMGYRPLLAFELARICTTTLLPNQLKSYLCRRWWRFEREKEHYKFYNYFKGGMGVLSQGASTSPMLGNLAARALDIGLTKFSDKYGFVYTRYADDLTLSISSELPAKFSIGAIHQAIIKIINQSGFKENSKKTRVSGPGAKKIVLGLLVDGQIPRISKETFKRIDRNLHAANKYGLVDVAKHENFDSAIGFYNHLRGLVAFVKDVDLERWKLFNERFESLQLP